MKCSFCGKDQKDVKVLINADGASICEGCVAICVYVLVEKMVMPSNKTQEAGE